MIVCLALVPWFIFFVMYHEFMHLLEVFSSEMMQAGLVSL